MQIRRTRSGRDPDLRFGHVAALCLHLIWFLSLSLVAALPLNLHKTPQLPQQQLYTGSLPEVLVPSASTAMLMVCNS